MCIKNVHFSFSFFFLFLSSGVRCRRPENDGVEKDGRKQKKEERKRRKMMTMRTTSQSVMFVAYKICSIAEAVKIWTLIFGVIALFLDLTRLSFSDIKRTSSNLNTSDFLS